MSYPLTAKANRYAREVVSGKIPACEFVRLACQRHLNDLKQENQANYPYRFSKEKSESILKFAELLPHVKGKWSGQNILLEPWQCFFLGCVFGWVKKTDNLRRFREVYACIPRKSGKALALDTEIPTPEGFKRIADIHAGDKVIGVDGCPCNVIAESEIFTDHECYEIEFSTGEKVIADAGHLWLTTAKVNAPNMSMKGIKKDGKAITRVRTTEEIFKTVRFSKRNDTNHIVQLANAVSLPEREYLVKPYILGAWLGDGTTRVGLITISYQDSVEMVGYLEQCGEVVKENKSTNKNSGMYSLTAIRSWNGKKRDLSGTCRLNKIGVLNNKHIPDEYFLGSYQQRLELLQGLMDTDGFIDKEKGYCYFYNTNKQLAYDVKSLVASLGLKPNFNSKQAKLHGVKHRICYIVSFIADRSIPVFKLKRKFSRQRDFKTLTSRSHTRTIVNVRPVESQPVKCISVDSEDSLFLITRSYIPTHNSVLGAVIGLYMFAADKELGAEVYAAATSEAQAYEVFRPAWMMVSTSPDMKKYFNIELGGTAKNPGNIYSLSTASRFETVIGKPGDGSSPHCWILDEFHEAKTDESYDTGKTGMGARSQPLMCVITTAGTNTSYPCYSKQKQVEKVLSGEMVNDELFGIIYTIDKNDDWTKIETWKKANPNYGVSVFEDFLKGQLRTALQDPRKQNIVKCKHLNMWSNAGDAWMNMAEWSKCGDSTLDITDFEGEPCYLGLDLASKIDIAAAMMIFKRKDEYYLFSKYYIPEERTYGENMAHYAGWAHDGYLETTPGSRIDIERIQNDIRDLAKRFDLSGSNNGGGEVCNDPWNAQQLITNLMNDKIGVVEVPQTVAMLSEPMKELEAAVLEGKFHHDNNPCTYWMFANVCCKIDKKDNIFPFKEGEENKIDGAVATITAMARAMYDKGDAKSVYEDRGVLTF